MKNRTKLKNIIKKKYMKTGNFTLSSGMKSNLYFDIKSLLLDSEAAYNIGFEMYSLIRQKHPNFKEYGRLGGMELGSALLLPMMAMLGFKCFVLRKEPKKHGLENSRLIGELNWHESIILIDDVITTGKSVMEVEDYIGRSSIDRICIIDRSKDQEFTSIFKEKDFLK